MPGWFWGVGGFVAGAMMFGLGRWRRVAGAGPEIAAASGTLEARIQALGQRQRAVLDRLLRHDKALRDPNETFDKKMTFGQRLADQIAEWGGSWTFIGL